MDVNVDMSGEIFTPKDASGAGSGGTNIVGNSKFSFATISSKFPQSIGQIFIQLRQNLRSFAEFLNVHNFKTIPSIQRLSNRLARNLTYFQSNYICVFLILMAYCLVTSPLILLVLIGVLYACYRIRQLNAEFTIMGKPLTISQQCFIINCMAAPILYLVGAGAALFWTLGASLFVISLHAAFYNIDAIVTEDMEGFLAEVV